MPIAANTQRINSAIYPQLDIVFTSFAVPTMGLVM